jgi:hypothetical protein
MAGQFTKPPEPIREGDHWLIPLSKELFAKVSDKDVEKISKFKWCASLESRGTKWYAIRWIRVEGKQVKVRMHHVVFGIEPKDLPPGHIIDHDNDDSLDNRDWNLKMITQVANMEKVKTWKKKAPEPFL